MADDSLKITVSYNGRERRIPLVVQPSLELSDFQVDQAELELCGIVRLAFNVPTEVEFSLREAETNRTLTKESFRDPSYLQAFPKYWYLTVEKSASEGGEEEEKSYEDSATYDYLEGLSDFDETCPSLAELSLHVADTSLHVTDVQYQNVCLTANSNGDFGVTLRYFSIQQITGPSSRPESPTEQPMFGANSQGSQQSSESTDILPTTFVHRIEGVGLEAGLQRGDTVHMINGTSIMRSSYSEIQDLLAQCGSELTLMVLPQENDDLQFIYSDYTEGRPGEYTSGEERVVVKDIPLVVGNGTCPPGEDMEGGPSGGERGDREGQMYNFDGSASSLDHTHSNSSSEHINPAGDDNLINCSIYDIPISSPSKGGFGWTSRSGGTGSNSQLDRLEEDTVYTAPSWRGEDSIANGDLEYEYRSMVDPHWYHDPPEDEGETTSSNKDKMVRAHSQDSAVSRRISVQSAPGGEGSHSQPMWAEDLGVVRIRNKKSLEMLTSLSTAPPPPRGMRRIQSDNVIIRNQQDSIYDKLEPESGTSSRPHHEDTSTTPTFKAPPADSFKSDTLPAGKQGSGVRPRKAMRSYSSQREQLHKTRSRTSSTEAAVQRAESLRRNLSQPPVEEGSRVDRDVPEAGGGQTASVESVSSESVMEEEAEDQMVTTPTILVEELQGGEGEREEGRRRTSHTLRHHGSSPPLSPHNYQSATMDPRFTRPPAVGNMSWGHPHRQHGLTKSVEVPLPSTGGTRRLPIVKTRSAQTPFGTEIVREYNIDEAVAASQGGLTTHSTQPASSRSFSIDSGEVGSEGGSMLPPSFSSRRHSLSLEQERSTTNKNVPCHGMLYKKQVSSSHGRKSSARNWRPFYTVLVGSHMVFYKDKRDADANKPCEEPPLEVVPGRADLTHGYTRRKCVFRVVLASGAEYLMQCEDTQSMLHWVTAIHRLNGGGKMVEQQRPKVDSRLLTPSSPLAARRSSSPQPHSQPTGKARGGRKGLVRNLKNVVLGKRGSSSQYRPSFGQLLADCPMSTENKCVPIVVEFCVHEVETHGLEVEGIYRKPGQRSIIRNMVAEIDKGQFEFEDYGDIHTIGSLLKKFFQELTDSLIPGDRYKEFLAVVMETPGETEQVTRLRGLVFHLPVAHYHTLRYLTRHLNRVADNSELNKMVLRNVAMVFGPTLMLRSQLNEDLDLVAMNTTFTVVELLCKHWHNIFDSETCHEEQQREREMERERQKEALREEEGGGLGAAQRTSSDPAVNILKVKKDNALVNASPKMLRRIQNQLNTSRRSSDRNSYSGGEPMVSASFSRKQHNHSKTLPMSTFLSPPNTGPGKSWGRAGSSGTLQSVRHREGEMRFAGGDLNPHSRYPVGREQWGGAEEAKRDLKGSIWAKSKDPQRGRGLGKEREFSGRSQILSSHLPPPIAHQRELLTTYQHPSPSHTLPSHRHTHSIPSHDALHRSATVPSPEHHSSLPTHPRPPLAGSTLHSPGSPGMRRKISYNMAVGDGYPPNYRYVNMQVHHSNEQGHYSEGYQGKGFSHSYGPQNTSRSTNHSIKSGSHSSQQPQRGDPVRKHRNHESYL